MLLDLVKEVTLTSSSFFFLNADCLFQSNKKKKTMDSSRLVLCRGLWNRAYQTDNEFYYQETYAISIFFAENKLHFQLDISIAIVWKFLFQEATLYDHSGLYL